MSCFHNAIGLVEDGLLERVFAAREALSGFLGKQRCLCFSPLQDAALRLITPKSLLLRRNVITRVMVTPFPIPSILAFLTTLRLPRRNVVLRNLFQRPLRLMMVWLKGIAHMRGPRVYCHYSPSGDATISKSPTGRRRPSLESSRLVNSRLS
jgi:hypothetical protein